MSMDLAAAVVSGFTIGNLIYARFSSKNYGRALEISFHQALAITAYLVAWQIMLS